MSSFASSVRGVQNWYWVNTTSSVYARACRSMEQGLISIVASNVCAVAHTDFQSFENHFRTSPKLQKTKRIIFLIK